MLQYTGRAVTQAVRRRLLTADAWIRSQVSPCGTYGGLSGARTGCYPNSSVVPCPCLAPVLHTHLDRHGCLTRGTNELSLGTFQKAVLFRKFGIIGYKICHLLFFPVRDMPRFVRPTLKCGCFFQFQNTLKTGIVSSESGESSWRKFGLGQAALCYCALWGVRRQRCRLLTLKSLN